MISVHSCIIVSALLVVTLALPNGLGRTPPMGWNTWYALGCHVTDTAIKANAQALVDRGFATVGYDYVNLDDCIMLPNRTATGHLQPDPAVFPSGIVDLINWVHSKNFKFGLYTDRGTMTCARRAGAYGHSDIDARDYASWGVDYLKEDSCFASGSHPTAFHEYGLMRDALAKTGRSIYFSLCGWEPWYAPVGHTLGNSWRIGPDTTDWSAVLQNINIISTLAQYAGPGGWNDPVREARLVPCNSCVYCKSSIVQCLLIGSGGDPHNNMTAARSAIQFAVWAVAAAPLLVSGRIADIDAATVAVYTNKEIIDISQDTLGRAGGRLVGTDVSPASGGVNVWGRRLAGASAAVLFFNVGPAPVRVTCDAKCIDGAFGEARPGNFSVRDVFNHRYVPNRSAESITVDLPAEGVVLYRLETP